MKLVIGGAYQGKFSYAKKQYRLADGWVDGRDCPMEAIWSCRGINQFHEYIKRMLPAAKGEAGETAGCADAAMSYTLNTEHLTELEQQATEFAKILKEKNPELVLVSTELGCGVVPVDKQDRLWREAVGRICTCIAAEADEVVRVVCGIGVRLT